MLFSLCKETSSDWLSRTKVRKSPDPTYLLNGSSLVDVDDSAHRAILITEEGCNLEIFLVKPLQAT